MIVLGKILLSDSFTNRTIFSNAGSHNSIFRGIDLGNEISATQYNSIKNGTFENMFIGDFWHIGVYYYRIAAFDYYLYTGDTPCNDHHIVLIPDGVMGTVMANDNYDMNQGYIGSQLRSNLSNCKSIISNAFGSEHLMKHRNCFTNKCTNGYPIGVDWYDSNVEHMSYYNVYGAPVSMLMRTPGYEDLLVDYVDNAQYPLFLLDHSWICRRENYWLRDICGGGCFAAIAATGMASRSVPNISLGVRPSFCIYQK